MRRVAVAVLALLSACLDIEQTQEVNLFSPPSAQEPEGSTGRDGGSSGEESEGGGGSVTSDGGESSTGRDEDEDGSGGAPAFDVAGGADDGASWCPVAPHPQDIALLFADAVTWVARPGEAVLMSQGGYDEPAVLETRYRLAPGTPTPYGVAVSADGRAVVAHSLGLTLVHSVLPDPSLIGEGGPWGACAELRAGDTAERATPNEAVALAWGTDACVGWSSPLTGQSVAWSRGAWDPGSCSFSDAVVYVGAADGVHVLDGETGDEITVAPTPGLVADLVTGRDGEAWGLIRGEAVVRVDPVTFAVEVHPLPVAGTGWGLAYVPHHSDGDTVVACDGTGVSVLELDSMTWGTLWDWRDEPEPGALLASAGQRGCAPIGGNFANAVYSTTNHEGQGVIRRVHRRDDGLWGAYEELIGSDPYGAPWQEVAAGRNDLALFHSRECPAGLEWACGDGAGRIGGRHMGNGWSPPFDGAIPDSPGGTIWGDPTGAELTWQ